MSRALRWITATALVAATGAAGAAPAAPAAGQGPQAPQGTQAGQEEQRAQMEGLQLSRSGPLEDPALEARATALADQLRCPVCQGLSIHDSPSPLAQDMKDLIRSQVAAGATDEEVRQYFISRYGEWVLLEPEARGFNLLVYVLPFAGLLLGMALIVVMVRKWTVPGGVPEDEPAVEAP